MENPFGPGVKKVEEVKKVEVKEVKVEETQKQSLSERMQILADCGGLESNVPLNSPYWKLK